MQVRTLPAAPAEVVAHAVLGNAGQRVVESVEVARLHLAILLERGRRDQHVPRLTEARIVDLQDEPGVDDGSIFRAQRLGDGEDVGFLGRVVAILAAADHGRGDGGHEGLDDRDAPERGPEGGQVLLEECLTLVGDGALADRGRRGHGHLARQVFGVVLAEGAPFPPAVHPPRPGAAGAGQRGARVGRGGGGDKPGEPVVGVGEKARLAHLAVGDDVEAGLRLAAHDVSHRLGGPRRQLNLVDRLAAQARPEKSPDAFRTGDAADVGSENALGAGLHRNAASILSQTAAGRS